MNEHVTELYQVTLLLRKVTDAMRTLGISGDLSNKVNKYYPEALGRYALGFTLSGERGQSPDSDC